MSLSSPLIVPSFLPFSSLSFLFLVFFFVLFSTLLLCQVGPYFHSAFSSIYSPLSSVVFWSFSSPSLSYPCRPSFILSSFLYFPLSSPLSPRLFKTFAYVPDLVPCSISSSNFCLLSSSLHTLNFSLSPLNAAISFYPAPL